MFVELQYPEYSAYAESATRSDVRAGGPKVKVLQRERERQQRSRAEVARAAGLTGTTYGWAESGRFIPYAVQLARIAEALEWEGDPSELLREIPKLEQAAKALLEDVTDDA
jgi:transcriptional regulator with XRE-family HTH domain